MRKVFAIILTTIMLISVLPVAAFADDEVYIPPLKYTDWYYNDDYTKVTVNGKTYDNYIVIMRSKDKLAIRNLGAFYLTDPFMQAEMTPEEYFGDRIKKSVKSVFVGAESKYPVTEVLYVNYKPWQETEFRDYNINLFERAYDNYHSKLLPKDQFFAFLSDKSNNGYAYEVFVNKKTVAEAKKAMPLEKMRIDTLAYELYKSSEEFKAAGSPWTQDENYTKEIEEPSMSAMLKRMAQPAPVMGDIPPENVADIAVTLYLNSKYVTITKNGTTKKVALDVAPYCPKGTTFVPLRGVIEEFGAVLQWIPYKNQVRINKGNTEILFTIGSKTALVDGKKVSLLEPAQIIKGRTLIPLRFVSEALGYKVKWYGDERKIVIYR